jgi:hypothetical protein
LTTAAMVYTYAMGKCRSSDDECAVISHVAAHLRLARHFHRRFSMVTKFQTQLTHSFRAAGFFVALMAALVMLSGCTTLVPPVLADPQGVSAVVTALPFVQKPTEVLKVDVVDIPQRFVIDEAPVYEDGMPAHGNTFITQGYIYPQGTLNGSNGVLPDGSAEFPDKVLGTWYCRGWFVGDGAHVASGEFAFTTQFFDFNEEYDNATLVTEGYEKMDFNQPFARAITGGTGRFMRARGEAMQELLGFTEDMAVNLRFEIHVTK